MAETPAETFKRANDALGQFHRNWDEVRALVDGFETRKEIAAGTDARIEDLNRRLSQSLERIAALELCEELMGSVAVLNDEIRDGKVPSIVIVHERLKSLVDDWNESGE